MFIVKRLRWAHPSALGARIIPRVLERKAHRQHRTVTIGDHIHSQLPVSILIIFSWSTATGFASVVKELMDIFDSVVEMSGCIILVEDADVSKAYDTLYLLVSRRRKACGGGRSYLRA